MVDDDLSKSTIAVADIADETMAIEKPMPASEWLQVCHVTGRALTARRSTTRVNTQHVIACRRVLTTCLLHAALDTRCAVGRLKLLQLQPPHRDVRFFRVKNVAPFSVFD